MITVLAIFALTGGAIGLLASLWAADAAGLLAAEPATMAPVLVGGIVVGGMLGILLILLVAELPALVSRGPTTTSRVFSTSLRTVLATVAVVALTAAVSTVAGVGLVWAVGLAGWDPATWVVAGAVTVGGLVAAGRAGRAVARRSVPLNPAG